MMLSIMPIHKRYDVNCIIIDDNPNVDPVIIPITKVIIVTEIVAPHDGHVNAVETVDVIPIIVAIELAELRLFSKVHLFLISLVMYTSSEMSRLMINDDMMIVTRSSGVKYIIQNVCVL